MAFFANNVYSASIGRSATSVYPNSMDITTAPFTTDDWVSEVITNGQNDAIMKIEVELGTKPAGAYNDVRTRLDTIARDTTTLSSSGLSKAQIESSTFTNVGADHFYGDGSTLTGILTSSGTARIPTVTISANNSNIGVKSGSQYICTGLRDDIIIQQAITELASGSRINFAEGDFSISSPIYITKSSITFSGVGYGTKLIFSSWSYLTDDHFGLFTTSQPVFGIVIRDMVLDGGWTPTLPAINCSTISGVAFNSSVDNLTIENCKIQNFNYGGVVTRLSGAIVKNARFAKNTITNIRINHAIGFDRDGELIVVEANIINQVGSAGISIGGESNTMPNISITQNVITGGNGNGIGGGYLSTSTIVGNSISDFGQGISLGRSYNVVIANNALGNCGRDYRHSIDFVYNKNCIISNNIISGGTNNGIIIGDSINNDIIISGNIITGKDVDGLETLNNERVCIIGNLIYNNGGKGFEVSGSSCVITGNISYGNTSGDANITDTGIYGTGNSWNTTIKP